MIDCLRSRGLAPALFLAVLLGLLCSPAHADFLTGNELYDNCNGTHGWREGFCWGYAIGVAATLADKPGFFCFPEKGLTTEQVADVVKLWLHNHPENRHYGASSLVIQALKEKFPCN